MAVNYFSPSDLEEFIGKEVAYLMYLHPLGTDAQGVGRYTSEIEEAKILKIAGDILHLEYHEKSDEREYKDTMLVPIHQIVEIRIQTFFQTFDEG